MTVNGKLNKNGLPKPKTERIRSKRRTRKSHKSDRQRKETK